MHTATLASARSDCLIGRIARREQASGNGSLALFHGVLHNRAALAADLALAGEAVTDDGLISALYQRYGADFVAKLEGEFSLILIDAVSDRLIVATDALANYSIRWHAGAHGFVCSSDLSALLIAVPEARRLCLPAVADYLTIGAIVGDKTLVEGVHELAPGTVLVYDGRQRKATTRSYFRVESLFDARSMSQQDYWSAVETSFKAAVDRAASTSDQLGLSLSGGLDSRAILAALSGRGPSLETYTLGVSGCADEVIAQQLAGLSGTRHVFFPLNSSYLRDFLPNMAEMVSITDGTYLTHGLTEMLAIRFIGTTSISVLLRGHGGELAKANLAWPLHTDPHVYTLKTLDELTAYLSARANYITREMPLGQIFRKDFATNAGRGSADSFAEVLAGTGLSPANACSFLYLRELNRRFTISSLELFRTRVDVRLPYLDISFLRQLLSAPPEWRDSTAIHTRLIRAGDPRMLRVRNSNTGAPAGAGPRMEFVFDKVNTILKRLNVPGYRHYHNFDGWMRRMLLDSVQAELLAPSSRVQQFIDRSTLTGLIDDTRQGRADRSYLLQVLLILELWQRENDIAAA